MAASDLHAFAVTAPGLAPLAADELRALGVAVREVEPAGVAFDATRAALQAANLWLRTASRVTVRLAEFRAEAFHELERRARQVPWERVTDGERPVRLRVTCRKSRLYHSDAVAERVADAIARRVGGGGGFERAVEDDHESDAEHDLAHDVGHDPPAQLFVVRFFHDRCTISADSSGALLHRRGYRQALAKAPLRETLAAGMLLASGWAARAGAPLVDPLCGSGTIPIEGALLARRIAPGRHRRFAFMDWPGFDEPAWRDALARADEAVLPAAPGPLLGADRDAGAVRAARENAERAGVAGDVAIEHRPLSALAAPPGPGWLVTNPPYGKRVGEPGPLRDLWTRLGDVARERCGGWTVAILSPDRRLDALTRLPLTERLATRNGGIPVRVMAGAVPISSS